MRRAAALPLLLACVLGLAGCSLTGGGAGPDQDEATLLLDFQPNAVHAGIYLATARDFDGAEGVDLDVEVPGSSTDGVAQLLSGRADFAVLDIHDLALARARGRDVVGVMALVQRPLAAVLAQPSIRTPRDLEGRRVGVTGLPSDVAVLDSVVAGAGGDPDRVRRTEIGFNAVPALLSRRVAAVTAFWNVEGVELRARRPGIKEFRVDELGAPSYPELVLAVARTTIQDDPELVRAVVGSLRRGYREVLGDPEAGIGALTEEEPDLGRDQLERELDAVSPAFTAGARTYGELDPARLETWARWEARTGIVDEPPVVAQAFAPRFSTAGQIE
ncbi:ABC transporter substrate-binding protein [Conexibacter sp. SYSU D00693]|uniref:ABC transporter substrate-binding protein n=1 Tax=Conexibacter sp. SYSU D00693 TaxID=2812560 RepID=UPI00196B46DB|nr:ABC transporter substrate-binding protein [Conexibacter sp. SYSU D00693]